MAADHLNLLFGRILPFCRFYFRSAENYNPEKGRILPFSGFYEVNRPGLLTQICLSENRSIPPEARIMSIADVHDAQVSKRVCKESMSFEKANAIIMEGMGSQFDPAIEPVCQAAKPEPEAYYI